MKKIAYLWLVFLSLFLASCGNNNTQNTSTTQSSQVNSGVQTFTSGDLEETLNDEEISSMLEEIMSTQDEK